MADLISSMPDEVLDMIAIALGPEDRLNLACTSRRLCPIATDVLFRHGAVMRLTQIPKYIAFINQRAESVGRIRSVEVSQFHAWCFLSRETVQECMQALETAVLKYPSFWEVAEEVVETMLDTRSRLSVMSFDGPLWLLVLLAFLGNVDHLTFMLHPSPSQHRASSPFEWDVHDQFPQCLKLRSLSIFCTGIYTGLRAGGKLELQHFSAVKTLGICTDIMERIELSDYPPQLETLSVFDRTCLSSFPLTQLRGLAHGLRGFRLYFHRPEAVELMNKTLADIKDVLSKSAVTCRIFYAVQILEGAEQFDPSKFPNILLEGETLMDLKPPTDADSSSQNKRVRSTVEESQQDTVNTSDSLPKKRKLISLAPSSSDPKASTTTGSTVPVRENTGSDPLFTASSAPLGPRPADIAQGMEGGSDTMKKIHRAGNAASKEH